MLAAIFIGFVLVMLGAVMVAARRFLPGRAGLVFSVGLVGWLGYVGVISYLGVVGNVTMRPPGGVFLFLPLVGLVALVIFRTRAAAGGAMVAAVPVGLLIGAQVFRVPVELFLHQLWQAGIVPKMLTFEGANVDIYVGATAPVAAWMATRGPVGRRVAIGWNVLGLAALANVVGRAILTAPGPLKVMQSEVPNRMIGMFPYTYIPGFFVLLAVGLHVVALRVLGRTRAEGVSVKDAVGRG